jgi:hypothetical protein
MASSYLNIVTFLLTTLFYYLALKPALPYATYANKEQYMGYIQSNYLYLAIYVLLVILIQFMVNSSILSSTCGGNLSENMGAAGLLTFIPWTLIFGVLVLVLSMYPGFKSAFSDVVGYYYVAGSANKLLTELLLNQNVETNIDKDPTMTPEKKRDLESAADAIIKICGNTSILINQMVPNNFDQYWSVLQPLMKEQYRVPTNPESIQMRSNLFELVVTRDNVGEAMWYIYTGLLLTSIVQLKMATRGCTSNPQTMEANYQKFLEQEKQAKEEEQKSSTNYTITN